MMDGLVVSKGYLGREGDPWGCNLLDKIKFSGSIRISSKLGVPPNN